MKPYLLKTFKRGGGIKLIKNAYILYTPVYSYLFALEPPELFLKPEVFRRFAAGMSNPVFAEDVKLRSARNAHMTAACDPSTQVIYFDFKYQYEHVLARSYIAPYTTKILASLHIPAQFAVDYKTKVISYGAETEAQRAVLLSAYEKVYKKYKPEGVAFPWIKPKGIS